MNKGILVIGGGLLQERAIACCKKLKFKVFLIDGSKNCYCKNLVDNFYHIDCYDLKRILKLSKILKKNNKIHGVYTQGADFAHTVAHVAENLGFVSVNKKSAKICKNKYLLRKKLSKNKLSNNKFFKIKSLNQLKDKIKKIKLPAYLKPLDNSASRGVIKISDYKQIKDAYEFAIKNCVLEKSLILEEEILGKELSVDTIIYNKQIIPCGISERKFKQKKKYAIQYASVTPAFISKKLEIEAYKVMSRAAKLLGINNSAFKGDLVIDSKTKKIKIIELTPRLSGGFDAQYRKPISYDLNLIKYTILIAMNIKFDINNLRLNFKKYSSTFSVLFDEGIFQKFENIEKIKKIKNINKIFLLSKKNDKIEKLTNCSQRNNYFICSADSKKQLYNTHEKIKRLLNIKYA